MQNAVKGKALHFRLHSKNPFPFQFFMIPWNMPIKKEIQVLSGKTNKEAKTLSLFFYLFCGSQSPFFGKDAMKTFERYFLKNKELHKEKKLFWEKNVQQDYFQRKMKEEFLIDHVVYGHVPRE